MLLVIFAILIFIVFMIQKERRKRIKADTEQTAQDSEIYTAFLNKPDDEKPVAYLVKRNNDMQTTYSIKGIGSGFVIVILVGFGVYWFYRGMIYPHFKADEARLEMLSKDRDRLLEYEPMGKIVDSHGHDFNIYYKEDAYYIYDNGRYYDGNSIINSERQQALSEYASSLSGHGSVGGANGNRLEHSDMLDKYIKLTPCTYYDDRGHHYNYCFFCGSDRVYFNI